MVERVARGRIMVPAAAALTVMATGLMKPQPVEAAGRDATIGIRVQVVEPCSIRLGPSGALEHECGGGGSLSQTPVAVQLAALVEQLARQPLPGASTAPALPPRPSPIGTPLQPPTLGAVNPPLAPLPTMAPLPAMAPMAPSTVSFEAPSARRVAANQRATDVVERITQRVRHITVAY